MYYFFCLLIGSSRVLKIGKWSKIDIKDAGFDGRFLTNETNIDNTQLYDIQESFAKLATLKMLENPKVSVFEKLDQVQINRRFFPNLCPNITRGGLYDDWNF